MNRNFRTSQDVHSRESTFERSLASSKAHQSCAKQASLGRESQILNVSPWRGASALLVPTQFIQTGGGEGHTQKGLLPVHVGIDNFSDNVLWAAGTERGSIFIGLVFYLCYIWKHYNKMQNERLYFGIYFNSRGLFRATWKRCWNLYQQC